MKISYKAAIKGRENYYNGKIDIMNIPMIVPLATHFSYSYSRIYVIQSMDDVPSKCKVHLSHYSNKIYSLFSVICL